MTDITAVDCIRFIVCKLTDIATVYGVAFIVGKLGNRLAYYSVRSVVRKLAYTCRCIKNVDVLSAMSNRADQRRVLKIGVSTFYPTSNNASGGTPLFTSILNVQTTAVNATNNGSNVPNAAVYSVSTSAVVADAVVSGGNAVPNGTQIYCLIIGV